MSNDETWAERNSSRVRQRLDVDAILLQAGLITEKGEPTPLMWQKYRGTSAETVPMGKNPTEQMLEDTKMLAFMVMTEALSGQAKIRFKTDDTIERFATLRVSHDIAQDQRVAKSHEIVDLLRNACGVLINEYKGIARDPGNNIACA